VDANGRVDSEALSPGRTDRAPVNRCQCRSLLTWMDRIRRGDVSFDRSNVPAEHRWRLDEHLGVRQFVETVARDNKELVDDCTLNFERPTFYRPGSRTRRNAGVPGLPWSTSAGFASAIHGSPTLAARRARVPHDDRRALQRAEPPERMAPAAQARAQSRRQVTGASTQVAGSRATAGARSRSMNPPRTTAPTRLPRRSGRPLEQHRLARARSGR